MTNSGTGSSGPPVGPSRTTRVAIGSRFGRPNRVVSASTSGGEVMAEFVTLIAERRWIDDDSGNDLAYREAEGEFRAGELDALPDEALVAMVRRLIERTTIAD